MLSQITTCLDPEMVRSNLDWITLGAAYWAEVHDPAIAEGDHDLEQEVHITAWCILVQMHVIDLAGAQRRRSSAEHSLRLAGSPKED